VRTDRCVARAHNKNNERVPRAQVNDEVSGREGEREGEREREKKKSHTLLLKQKNRIHARETFSTIIIIWSLKMGDRCNFESPFLLLIQSYALHL